MQSLTTLVLGNVDLWQLSPILELGLKSVLACIHTQLALSTLFWRKWPQITVANLPRTKVTILLTFYHASYEVRISQCPE